MRIGLAAVALLSALLTGCLGGISTDGHGLRTFSWTSGGAFNTGQPLPVVQGTLRTDPAQSDPVWLVDRDGNRLSVVFLMVIKPQI